MGEATTKQNTMNVPMCKLQAEERHEDRWLVLVSRLGRALNYLDKCARRRPPRRRTTPDLRDLGNR